MGRLEATGQAVYPKGPQVNDMMQDVNGERITAERPGDIEPPLPSQSLRILIDPSVRQAQHSQSHPQRSKYILNRRREHGPAP